MPVRSFQGISPKLGANVYIDDMAVVIGDVTIGDDASLWPFVVARGDVQRIRIGARTNVQDGSVLHVTQDNRFNAGGYALTIGNDVTVGHNAVLHACTIEDFVLVGMGSIILDGAVVQSRAMVAAGSVVSPGKVLEGGFLWLGQPAKKIRPLTEDELAYLEYSSGHYL
ncbi:MAG: gamma carbonic anhydrase family protein, partial [Planctomycetes bacterium]|nr:gamma carbonic anhydrase family protein [Planctomycetota bacterium]